MYQKLFFLTTSTANLWQSPSGIYTQIILYVLLINYFGFPIITFLLTSFFRELKNCVFFNNENTFIALLIVQILNYISFNIQIDYLLNMNKQKKITPLWRSKGRWINCFPPPPLLERFPMLATLVNLATGVSLHE